MDIKEPEIKKEDSPKFYQLEFFTSFFNIDQEEVGQRILKTITFWKPDL
jgi:hypothetical protein